jgi:cytosine/adenosine deaminase-related metal-dependent hydrolase
VLDFECPSTFASPTVDVYDRIVFTAARDAVRAVYVAGRLVFDGRRMVAVDSTELLRRAGEELDSLLRRAEL